MPELEGHGTAWSRCYEYRSTREWIGEDKCPIRLRGYSELVMGRVPPKMRKTIDSALKRGYRLSNKKDLRQVLDLILEHNPIAPIPLGYIGKTRFNVFVHGDKADDLIESLAGLAVIDDAYAGREAAKNGCMRNGYREVYVREWIRAGGKGSDHQPQLKASFRHARAVIDTYMDEDAATREQIARWCAADDCTIRIPFDTHKEKDNAS